MLNNLEPAVGRLLISEPFMQDPNFSRSVVLLTEYGTEGAVGFVINQPTKLLLKDLIPEFTDLEFPIYYGGPVDVDTIYFIHRCADRVNEGEEIAKGIYWGGNFASLSALISKGTILTHEIKFFLGCSGWGNEQLRQEIKQNTWMISDQYHPDTIFSVSEEQMWKDVIINLGPKYAHVSNFPQDPTLN